MARRVAVFDCTSEGHRHQGVGQHREEAEKTHQAAHQTRLIDPASPQNQIKLDRQRKPAKQRAKRGVTALLRRQWRRLAVHPSVSVNVRTWPDHSRLLRASFTYNDSTFSRAHGVLRRNVRLDLMLGSLLKQRMSMRSASPDHW